MKNSIYMLILATTIAHGASTSGPLTVGHYDPIVSETATNQIKSYIHTAVDKNKELLPGGSVTTLWNFVALDGVTPYFTKNPDQLSASTRYVTAANANESVQAEYRRITTSSNIKPGIRKLLWNVLICNASMVYAQIERETIPKLNLRALTVVGIMLSNQNLTFTDAERTSFGGAVAAEISIMNLMHKTDPESFKAIYKDFLPSAPEDSK